MIGMALGFAQTMRGGDKKVAEVGASRPMTRVGCPAIRYHPRQPIAGSRKTETTRRALCSFIASKFDSAEKRALLL